MEKETEGKLSDFNYQMAVNYRHERDHWKQIAEREQAKAIVFKTLFAMVLGIFLGVITL